jgi:hypothetical protein
VTVNVNHHGRCFDGAASAALFTEFYRRHIDGGAEFAYIPKIHRTGDPYDPEDFSAEVNASVDFRYSQNPRLHWYFDHHKSAFQLPGDREHFLADTSGQKFHDSNAPSCASYMAGICHEKWGYDASEHAELIRWSEVIDQARFPSPEVPVLFEEPAMKIAGFIQVVIDAPTIEQLVKDLIEYPLEKVAEADYLRSVMGPRLEQHHEDMALIQARTKIEKDVLEYDLLDTGPRVFSHFIPYYFHRSVRYVVGTYAHSDGDLRITAGYNPWLPPEEREHDIAHLCERFGGGGHAHVGGVSFPLDAEPRCHRSFRAMLDVLRGKAP